MQEKTFSQISCQMLYLINLLRIHYALLVLMSKQEDGTFLTKMAFKHLKN